MEIHQQTCPSHAEWIFAAPALFLGNAIESSRHEICEIPQCNRAGRTAVVRKKMATGTVKWFNNDKGFGFITPDDGGKDLFAHHTEIESTGYRSLQEGAKVEFEVREGPKGLQASKIRTL